MKVLLLRMLLRTEVLVIGSVDSKIKKQNLNFLTFNNTFKDQLYSNYQDITAYNE